MQESELQKQLREDAAQEVPPFAADSVRLARQMGAAASGPLLEQIKAQGKTSFLALEALREADPDAYRSLSGSLRAGIYGEALRAAGFYNAWGVPGYQLTDTARAFIALGEDAVAVLKPLLDDEREAPLSGSQSATTSRMYGNRVCDYAWVFISEIRHQPYNYSRDAAERNRAIEKLRQSL
jgi:hypothetical protein